MLLFLCVFVFFCVYYSEGVCYAGDSAECRDYVISHGVIQPLLNSIRAEVSVSSEFFSVLLGINSLCSRSITCVMFLGLSLICVDTAILHLHFMQFANCCQLSVILYYIQTMQ